MGKDIIVRNRRLIFDESCPSPQWLAENDKKLFTLKEDDSGGDEAPSMACKGWSDQSPHDPFRLPVLAGCHR